MPYYNRGSTWVSGHYRDGYWVSGHWRGGTMVWRDQSDAPSPPPTPGTVTAWAESRDCCWLTRCPNCKDPVYFVRHNGGSVWFDPPLGYPWYKHECVASRRHNPQTISEAIDLLPKWNRTPVLIGVVTTTVVKVHKQRARLTIKHGDNELYEREVLTSVDATKLVGTLIVVAKDHEGSEYLYWGEDFPQRGRGITS